jgi:hypothetical protein
MLIRPNPPNCARYVSTSRCFSPCGHPAGGGEVGGDGAALVAGAVVLGRVGAGAGAVVAVGDVGVDGALGPGGALAPDVRSAALTGESRRALASSPRGSSAHAPAAINVTTAAAASPVIKRSCLIGPPTAAVVP